MNEKATLEFAFYVTLLQTFSNDYRKQDSRQQLIQSIHPDAGQPAHVPGTQPQQVTTPTPQDLKTKETTLMTPSPRTKPLATTMRRISLALAGFFPSAFARAMRRR